MFGLASSAGVFGAVADMLVDIYREHGISWVIKWVDDFFVIRPPHQCFSEADFIAITAQLGVPWSLEKTRLFATMQRYIGFLWDLEHKTVAIPPEKVAAMLALLSHWSGSGFKALASEAASLHGKLVHLATIFRLLRPFTRSVALFAAGFRSHRARLHPPKDVLADIKWITWMLPILPNQLPLSSPSPVDLGWWGDASSSFGIGVVIGSFWAVWAWAPGFRVGPHCHGYDIGWAETVAVELALRIAIDHGLIEMRPSNSSRILVRSDNSGVVSIINHGRARSRTSNIVLREIYQLLAAEQISLAAEYVPSRLNI
ncbi:hypothetical protein LXA43DRAFT_928897, partial [Ganoderma leucocontextum]